jgi:hypothetical protein
MAENILPERAIDAFWDGLIRRDFKEELGRCKPKTIDHLMSLANEWPMGKTPSQPLGAADDRQNVTSMQKISFTPTLTRKVAEAATMMRIQQTW